MMTDHSNSAVPKIIDFGLSRVVGPNQTTIEPFGTLGYVAPEVLKQDPYSFTCDIWSLGCITYAMLSGSLPFDHQQPVQAIKMTLKEPLQFDLPCWKSISEHAKGLITGMLIKEPDQRMTIHQVLEHPWFKTSNSNVRSSS